MARGHAEIELRVHRHGGQAEQAAARGRIIAVAGLRRMRSVVLVRRAVRMDMRFGVPLRVCVAGGGLMRTCEAELLVGEAVRRVIAGAERHRGRRRNDAQRVEGGDDDRPPSSRRSGQPNKHRTHLCRKILESGRFADV